MPACSEASGSAAASLYQMGPIRDKGEWQRGVPFDLAEIRYLIHTHPSLNEMYAT